MDRPSLVRVGIGLLPILFVAAAPAPTVPAYHIFGSWVVACDNTRSCEARGFDETQGADMRVIRAAGQAGARIVLSAGSSIPAGGIVHVDGTEQRLEASAWVTHKEDGSDQQTLSTSDPAVVGAFVRKVRNGHTLMLPGADPATVPLDGLSAALLFMDAVQGRQGTAAPLVAPVGTALPPPAPGLPRPPRRNTPDPLTSTERRGLIARAKAFPSPPDEPCDRTEDAEVYALDANSALAIRQCVLYAYQGSALVYVLPRTGGGPAVPVNLAFPGVPKDEGDPPGPRMIAPEFDPKTGRLSVTEKARGPGDCGLAAEWGWAAGAFHLTSLVFLDKCGEPDPGDFLTLYRSAGGG